MIYAFSENCTHGVATSRRGVGASRRFAALRGFTVVTVGCVGMWSLSGCASQSPLAQAYAVYDARVAREVVAGHDDVRGNYVELRLAPRAGDGKAVVR